MSSRFDILPRDIWKRCCLVIFLLLWGVSCIRVPYPKYFPLQHVPTVVALVALVWADRRCSISRASYLLILAFLSLHLLGARYIYSYVPYDDWSKRLFGFHVTRELGLSRNHYDRLVHFCFGLLLFLPVDRFCRRFMGLSGAWSVVVATSLIVSASAGYEIFEWIVAVVMAPDWADSYNGQQGDPWDAQWDMLLALLGACIPAAVLLARRVRRIESAPSKSGRC